MKHCDAIDMEITPTGAIFRGSEWPAVIAVERDLLDYLPGPHVSFGRFGVLRFMALNGYGVYRRFEDRPGGWEYRLVENNLKAAAPAAAGPAEPQAKRAEAKFGRNGDARIVQAFQWLPHAVPPVTLPEWFMRSDFEHKADGELMLRQSGMLMKAAPADWIVRDGLTISVVKADRFISDYSPVAEAA